MGYKTISLSEEAYKRLAERKIGNESFSDVVLRITNNTTLRDFVEIVDNRLVEDLGFNIDMIRKNRSKSYTENVLEEWD